MTNLEYLNTKVTTTIKPSKYGIGAFAIKDIKKGEELQDKSKALITLTRKEFNLLDTRVKNLILDRNILSHLDKDLTFYSPNVSFDLPSFTNYSPTPNTDGLHAIQDIKEGEELTVDYKDSRMDILSRAHFNFL